MIITKETDAESIEEWDSLEQMYLIGAIQDWFNIKLSVAEATSLRNIGDLIDSIYLQISG